MRHKFVFLAIMGLAMLILQGALASAQNSDGLVPVLVTTRPLERGTVLIPDMLYGDNPAVEIQFWQQELSPQTAFRRLEDVEGLVVRLDLTARMPLLAGNLVPDARQSSLIGSDTALMMPMDTVAVPIRVENLYTAPPTLAELDCVSVSAIFDFGQDDLLTEFTFSDNGVVVENIAGTETVAVALDADAAVTAAWAQDVGLQLALRYSEDCTS